MPKNYDISKKSDMRRFQRDLDRVIREAAEKKLREIPFDAKCPHCGKAIQVSEGLVICPFCHSPINVTLDIDQR